MPLTDAADPEARGTGARVGSAAGGALCLGEAGAVPFRGETFFFTLGKVV